MAPNESGVYVRYGGEKLVKLAGCRGRNSCFLELFNPEKADGTNAYAVSPTTSATSLSSVTKLLEVRMLHLLPNAPDFTRCAAVRKYRLGGFTCVLVEKPKAIICRVSPNVPAINFLYAMVFLHDAGDVRLIVTSERSDGALTAAVGLVAADEHDSKAFLCLFRQDGIHENLGKFEGLDNENVFSRIALELCAREFSLQEEHVELIFGVADDEHLDLCGNLKTHRPSTAGASADEGLEPPEEFEQLDIVEEPQEEVEGEGDEVVEEPHPLGEVVERLRSYGDCVGAAELQGWLDMNRSRAIARSLRVLEPNGTGDIDRDLREAVEELRADGDAQGAFLVQECIHARQSSRLISRFSDLLEREGSNLQRLHKQLDAAAFDDDSALMDRLLGEQFAIYRKVCPAVICLDEFNGEKISAKLAGLRVRLEEARADAETVIAVRLQKEIDDLIPWIVAVEVQINR